MAFFRPGLYVWGALQRDMQIADKLVGDLNPKKAKSQIAYVSKYLK